MKSTGEATAEAPRFREIRLEVVPIMVMLPTRSRASPGPEVGSLLCPAVERLTEGWRFRGDFLVNALRCLARLATARRCVADLRPSGVSR